VSRLRVMLKDEEGVVAILHLFQSVCTMATSESPTFGCSVRPWYHSRPTGRHNSQRVIPTF
jgi:hypothetical protein